MFVIKYITNYSDQGYYASNSVYTTKQNAERACAISILKRWELPDATAYIKRKQAVIAFVAREQYAEAIQAWNDMGGYPNLKVEEAKIDAEFAW